jgi:putative intracellular protease/amidase
MEEQVPFLLERELVHRGAHYSKAGNWDSHVVQDGNLLTGQNPTSAKPLINAIIEALKTRHAKKVRHESEE